MDDSLGSDAPDSSTVQMGNGILDEAGMVFKMSQVLDVVEMPIHRETLTAFTT